MKKIFLCILTLFCLCYTHAQYEDFTDVVFVNPNNLKSTGMHLPYIPNANTPMKYVRINIHYMLKTGGVGNFTETDDGVNANSPYNGYYVASELIRTANQRLLQNEHANIPPGNNYPVLSPKYCFVLDGVYFHIDDGLYPFGAGNPIDHGNTHVEDIYSINSTSVINVFKQGPSGGSGSAHANQGESACWLAYKDFWGRYKFGSNNFAGLIWVCAKTLIHEAGHNMNLDHTLLTPLGVCDPTTNDRCNDTPSGTWMESTYPGVKMCDADGSLSCEWCENGIYCSNNVMDYNCHVSITPEQLGWIHLALSGYMENHNVCKAPALNNDLNYTNIPDDQILVMGKNLKFLKVATNSTIIKSGHTKNIIFSNSLTIEPPFEIQAGGGVNIFSVTSCP